MSIISPPTGTDEFADNVCVCDGGRAGRVGERMGD